MAKAKGKNEKNYTLTWKKVMEFLLREQNYNWRGLHDWRRFWYNKLKIFGLKMFTKPHFCWNWVCSKNWVKLINFITWGKGCQSSTQIATRHFCLGGTKSLIVDMVTSVTEKRVNLICNRHHFKNQLKLL